MAGQALNLAGHFEEGEEMATYCECGHVLAEHVGDGEDGEQSYCLECECEMFTKVPEEELDREYD